MAPQASTLNIHSIQNLGSFLLPSTGEEQAARGPDMSFRNFLDFLMISSVLFTLTFEMKRD
jgi:hypothetical protein